MDEQEQSTGMGARQEGAAPTGAPAPAERPPLSSSTSTAGRPLGETAHAAGLPLDPSHVDAAAPHVAHAEDTTVESPAVSETSPPPATAEAQPAGAGEPIAEGQAAPAGDSQILPGAETAGAETAGAAPEPAGEPPIAPGEQPTQVDGAVAPVTLAPVLAAEQGEDAATTAPVVAGEEAGDALDVEVAAPAPIARGTLIGERYTIVSEPQDGETESSGEVRYLATDALAYQQCWSCGSRENSQGMRFCQSCGAGLQDHPVVLAWTPHLTGRFGEVQGPQGYLHVVPQRRRFGAEGIGLQVGAHSAEGPHHPNEDSYWHTFSTTCGNSRRESQGLVIFADGMGGYQPGSGLISRRAAAVSGETLWSALAPYRLPDASPPEDAEIERLARGAIGAGNAAVLAEIERVGYEMGCTLVTAIIIGETAYVANVGDSRAYYLTPTGEVAQITEDQSHVGALVAAGQMSPDAVYTAVGNNVILHAIGEPGVEEAAGWSVQPLEPNGVLVLCSDGYWKTVRGAGQVLEAIAGSPTLDEAARALVNDALDRGSDDNTTVVLVRVL